MAAQPPTADDASVRFVSPPTTRTSNNSSFLPHNHPPSAIATTSHLISCAPMAPSFFSRVTSRLPPSSTYRFALKYAYYTAVGVAAVSFAQASLFEVTGVTGKSMAPTLSPQYDEAGKKDHLLFNRVMAARRLRRGDVVSFWAPHEPEQISVKRVVALPGDTVITRGRYPFKKVAVPYNHVWVEGDNWRHTVDSNDFGPVSWHSHAFHRKQLDISCPLGHSLTYSVVGSDGPDPWACRVHCLASKPL